MASIDARGWQTCTRIAISIDVNQSCAYAIIAEQVYCHGLESWPLIASWTWFTSIDIAIRVHVCQSLASIDAIYFVFSSMWSKGIRLFLHLKRSWQWSLETRNWLRKRRHYSWKCFAWPEAFFLECLREAKPFFYILNDVLQCEFFPFDLWPSRSK